MKPQYTLCFEQYNLEPDIALYAHTHVAPEDI